MAGSSLDTNFYRVAQEPPLVVTLRLETRALTFFDELRRAHFPSHLNFVPAHISLFHALPGEQRAGVLDAIEEACRDTGPIPLRVTGLRHMGRGVAYRLESESLMRLHGRLAAAFALWLTPQDRQPLRPHITIQNKVTPAQSKTLFEELQSTFSPFEIKATGVCIWNYLGGPWTLAGTVPFCGV